jgi:hypothetical protein
VSINASDHSHSLPQLFLGDGTVQVLEINLPSGMVIVSEIARGAPVAEDTQPTGHTF